MDKNILQELSHELDTTLGGVGLNLRTLKAIATEMGHIQEDVEETDQTDVTKMAMQFRDMSHKLIMITDLLHYTVSEFEGNHEHNELIKRSIFDVAHDKEDAE